MASGLGDESMCEDEILKEFNESNDKLSIYGRLLKYKKSNFTCI